MRSEYISIISAHHTTAVIQQKNLRQDVVLPHSDDV